MVTITCPWCEEEALLTFTDTEGPDTRFSCADCGTSVEFVEEPPAALDLAA